MARLSYSICAGAAMADIKTDGLPSWMIGGGDESPSAQIPSDDLPAWMKEGDPFSVRAARALGLETNPEKREQNKQETEKKFAQERGLRAQRSFADNVFRVEQDSGLVNPFIIDTQDKARDLGLNLAKGVVAVPETVVGVGNIVSGGHVGKAVEDSGVRFKDAKDFIGGFHSDRYKSAEQEIGQAQGFLNSLEALGKNPHNLMGRVVESVPSMGLGGAVSKVLPVGSAVVAAAAGEGIVGGGSAAEGFRQESVDKLITGKQAAASVFSGMGTALFSLLGGKAAAKLGIDDLDTVLASKAGSEIVEAMTPAANKAVGLKFLKGFVSEGLLEEMPQSMQERMFANYGNGKPLFEGVPESAAEGLLTGGVMGGSFSATHKGGHAEQSATDLTAPVQQTQSTSPNWTDPILGANNASTQPTAAGQPAAPSVVAAQSSQSQSGVIPGGATNPGLRDDDGTGLSDPVAAGASASGAESLVAGGNDAQQTQAVKPLNWFSFLKEKGVNPAALKTGTEQHAALKEEYTALKATPQAAMIAAAESQQTGEDPQLNAARDQIAQSGEVSAVKMANELGVSREEAGGLIEKITGKPAIEAIGKQADGIETPDGRMLVAPKPTALDDLESQVDQMLEQVKSPPAITGQVAPAVDQVPASIESAVQASQAIAATKKARATPDDLLGFLNASGGVSMGLKNDIDGDARGRPGLFRANGLNVDEIGAKMVEQGYITPDQATDQNEVLDHLRRAVGGERIMTAQGMQNAQAREEELKHRAGLVEQAGALGINHRSKSIDQLESAIDAHAQKVGAIESMSDAELADAIKAATAEKKKGKTFKNQREWQNLTDEKAKRQALALVAKREASEAKRLANLAAEQEELMQAVERFAAEFGSESEGVRWAMERAGRIENEADAGMRKSGYAALSRTINSGLDERQAEAARIDKIIEDSFNEDTHPRLQQDNLPGDEGDVGQVHAGAASEGNSVGGGYDRNQGDQSFSLESHDVSGLKAKTEREGDQALADKATADAQREGFTLAPQAAQESRSAGTADMFGGPSVADYQASQQAKQKTAGQQGGPDLFSEPAQSNNDQEAKPAQGKDSGESVAEKARADQESDVSQKAEKVSTSAEPVQNPAQSMQVSAKIEDAGDQLHWNRKNPWRGGGLKFEDLVDKNDTMRVKLTTKGKVWAKPDWAGWVKGLEQYDDNTREAMTIAGRLAKNVYDAIPASPNTKDDESLRRYIETVTQIKEATEQFLNDPDGVKKMLVETFAGSNDSLRRFTEGVKQAKHPIFAAVFPDQAGGAKWVQGTESHRRGVLAGKAVGAMQWNNRDYAKAKQDIDANGWPAKREAWQRQGLKIISRDDVRAAVGNTSQGRYLPGLRYPGGRWEGVTKDSVDTRAEAQVIADQAQAALPEFRLIGKTGRIIGDYKTEAAAIESARATTAKQGGRDEKEASEVWTLDTAKRIGAERRPHGKNVSSDELKEAFGFRGVNFGKWVPQDERQKHLNHAHDSFSDLAELLGVPPKALSLNGMLGIAFGAQGSGGGTAAHFVPGVNEINLTRTSGVGSLSHEWAHAMDHYFGVQAGLERDADPFVSELASRHERRWPAGAEIRPEIREAFVSLNKSLKERIETPAETDARKRDQVARARKGLDSFIERHGLDGKISAEVMAQLRAGVAGENVKLDNSSRKRYPETVGAIVKNVGEEAGFGKDDIQSLDAVVGMVKMTLDSLKTDAGSGRAIHTQFYKALQGIQNDSKKKQNGKDYWTQPTEMFARAFEAYAFDKLLQSESRNDYLVSDNRSDEDAPHGDERLAIGQAFDTLVAGIQTKETESGVTMAMRTRDYPRAGRALFMGESGKLETKKISTEDVRAAITPLVRSAKNLPPLQVYKSTEQLKKGDEVDQAAYAWMKDRNGLDSMPALMSNGRIYIFADSLSSIDQAREAILHEGLHYGLRGIMDSDTRDALMLQIRQANPGIAKAAREFLIENEDASEVEAIEEVIAEWSQNNEMSNLKGWAKIVATVRSWLRKQGFVRSWSDNDIRQLLIDAQDYWLRAPKNGYAKAVQAGTRAMAGNENSGYSDEEAAFFASQGIEVNRGKTNDAGRDASSGSRAPGGNSERLQGEAGFTNLAGEPAAPAWLDSSIAVSGVTGAPTVLYRGGGRKLAASDFDSGLGRSTGLNTAHFGVWLTTDGNEARGYGEIVERFHLDVRNPKRYGAEGPPAVGSPQEARALVAKLKAAGFDGIRIDYTEVGGAVHYVAFSSEQIIRPKDDGKTRAMRNYTPDEQAFRQKAGIGARPTMIQKLRRWGDGVRDSMSWDAFRQGALDQFHGIALAEARTVGALPVEQSAYVTARLATGASSVMRGLLMHGQAKWASNGQHLEKIDGTKGLLDILKPVEGQLDDWLGWMVANRANRLMSEGKENNFTADDIKAGLALANGREAEFKAVANEFAAFKRSVLDISEQAGLIDPAGRRLWDHADWIPFYRQMENDTAKAPGGKRGLSKQSSGIRQLKGGESAMNDPLENILMNFQHLIDASLKNNAMRKVVKNLDGSDIMESVGYGMQGVMIPRDQVEKQLIAAGTPQQMIDAMPPEAFEGLAKMWALHAPEGKDIVRVMDDGKPHFYRVNDPLLLRAVTSFEPINFPGLGTARAFKRLLTRSVTATPAFMARNFIRDSASTAIISRDRTVVLGAMRGMMKSYKEEGGFEDMLFAGASFAGGQSEGADPESTAIAMRRALREKGFSASSADEFMASLIDTPMKMWEKYKHISDSIENANREAVYEAAEKAGKSKTSAAFEAKDLMDFSLRGSWAGYQILADVTPFLNARVQGLYRLGRSDPKQIALRSAMMLVLPSIMIALANAGDSDYEELPDWEKDTYWHIFVGGKHFRIPKPFEVGVIFATIPERMTRTMLGNDSPKKLASRVWFNIADQFNLAQWPQFAKPALEVWANEDGFRKSPIENQSDEGKLPSMRSSYYTSDTMKALAGIVPGVSDATGLSPKRLEYLWNGYLGSVGATALGVSDFVVRRAQGVPYRETMRLDEYPLLGVFYRENPAKNSEFVEELYKMANESAQIKRSVDAARKAGDHERSDQMKSDNLEKMRVGKAMQDGAKKMTGYGKKIAHIRQDSSMTPEQKREAIDETLTARNRRAAEIAKRGIGAWGGSI